LLEGVIGFSYMSTPSSFLIVTIGGFVVALNRASGERVWEHALPSSLMSRCQTVVHESTVYAAAQSGHLLLLDYATGKQRACTTFKGSGQAPALLLDHETVFVIMGGEVTAFNLEGKILWHEPLKGKGNGAASLAFPGNDRQPDEY